MAAPSRELGSTQNVELQNPVKNPLSHSFNPITGLSALLTFYSTHHAVIHSLPAAIVAGRVVFPDGMDIPMSRRGLFKRAAAIGAAAAGAVALRPDEARAEEGEEELPGFAESLTSVELSDEARALMDADFETVAQNTRDNIDNFKKWIEEVGEDGERGADKFHKMFADFRSEIHNARVYGLTPPELVTDVMDSVEGQRGPIGFPADFSEVEGKAKAGRFFGKVQFGPVSNGHNVDDNLLIGGEADVVILGVTFHDYTSQTKDAEGKEIKGKVALVHFGGVNENKPWSASGFWNVIWPNEEFYSTPFQSHIETDPEKSWREWPYNPPAGEAYPAPQDGRAGINQLVSSINNGMATFRIGSTSNWDTSVQLVEDLKKRYGVDYSKGYAPDFQNKDFIFKTYAKGKTLLERLQLHAVNAMIEEPEKSGREMGIALFDYQNNTREDYIGRKRLLSLFPDAADPKKSPPFKLTRSFLDKPELTIEDLYEVPNIPPAQRFAYPSQFPDGFGQIMNPPQ